MKFAERAKAYAALLFGILTALSGTTGIIPEPAKPYVTIALAILGAIVTFQIPNAPAPAESLKPATHPESPFPPDGV